MKVPPELQAVDKAHQPRVLGLLELAAVGTRHPHLAVVGDQEHDSARAGGDGHVRVLVYRPAAGLPEDGLVHAAEREDAVSFLRSNLVEIHYLVKAPEHVWDKVNSVLG